MEATLLNELQKSCFDAHLLQPASRSQAGSHLLLVHLFDALRVNRRRAAREWPWWRKATLGELDIQSAATKSLRCPPIRGEEDPQGIPKDAANRPAGSMHDRRWRSLAAQRPFVRILPANPCCPCWLSSCRRSEHSTLALDLDDQLGDSLAIVLGREVFPAGQRRQRYGLDGGKVPKPELESASICLEFERPVEPNALSGPAGEKRTRAVCPRPIQGGGHQALLHAVRKDVLESGNLRRRLVTNRNGLETAAPNLVRPIV